MVEIEKIYRAFQILLEIQMAVLIFSFFFNNVFSMYTLEFPPLNSRVKKIKHVLNFFSKLGLIASIKTIKQNKGENIVQCWF